jgi:hypothetical protein
VGTTVIPVHGLCTVGWGMDLVILILNHPRSPGIGHGLPLLIIFHLHPFLDRLEPARLIHMGGDHTVGIPHRPEILDSDGSDVRLEPRVGTARGGDRKAVGAELGGVTERAGVIILGEAVSLWVKSDDGEGAAT